MKSLIAQIEELLRAALEAAFGEAAAGVDPLVRAAADPKFGDYQSNVAMGLGKRLGLKPRDVAQRIVDALPASAADVLESPEIAGPGFINLRLKTTFLQTALNAISPEPSKGDDRLGIERVDDAHCETVVVDYSSPNVAKQMHVGHLRSTVIGDTLARVLAFQGHDVVRQNHVGDWGTPMGMVILAVWTRLTGNSYERDALTQEEFEQKFRELEPRIAVQHFERLYQEVASRCKDDQHALQTVLRLTKALQQRDPLPQKLWQFACDKTIAHVEEIYRRLSVSLHREHICGESFYDPLLPGVVEELKAALQPRADASEQSRDRKGAVTHQSAADAASLAPPAASLDSTDGTNRGSERGNARNRRIAVSSSAGAGPLPDPDPHRDGSDRIAASQPNIRAVCREDEGALCVFLEKADGSPVFKGPQGDPLPMIVQKSDGAFLYATTDLAAMALRINHVERQPIAFKTAQLPAVLRGEAGRGPSGQPMPTGGGLGADRILYVVGAPQKLHFEMLFATVRALGWTRPGGRTREVRLEHVAFGSVLGEDRKMLRTRSGESVKLKDLLDEAVQRAEQLVRQTEADPAKRRGFPEAEIKRIAETVGIAAVKYADLCQNRGTDYVFSWDKMLALQGNTAPYMLYAYARIRSIYRKGEETARVGRPLSDAPADAGRASAQPGPSSAATPSEPSGVQLDHPVERALALCILRLAETIDSVGENLLPNVLCEYLYALAGCFMAFYEECPVLQAPNEATRTSRLLLCERTARALKLGLGLLGIQPLERM